MTYDVVVIGGGAAGLGTAREAARRGARVMLVEKDRLGGECTFSGCVPSKTLLAHAAKGHSWEQATAGIAATIATIAAPENAASLTADGVEVRAGHAQLLGHGRVDVDGTVLVAKNIVIATGAGPAVPPIEGLADLPSGVLVTSDNVFEMDRCPPRLAIVGGGAIGCELAQAFADLGTHVTLVEAAPAILGAAPADAAAVVHAALGKRGINVLVGTAVSKAERSVDGLGARLHANGTVIDVDRVLLAVGRTPTTSELGLDAAGVEVADGGHIVVDDHLATTADGVFAVGDVNGRFPFTHAAFEMGRLAATNALARRRSKFSVRSIPWVIFTQPEVAHIGLGEAEAAAVGGRVARVPLRGVDRALTDLDPADPALDGYVELIAGPRPVLRRLGGGQVLGATIVAPRAGELINEVALAMRTRMFVGRLAQTVHAYPTWGVALQEAAAQFFMDINGREARPARRNIS